MSSETEGVFHKIAKLITLGPADRSRRPRMIRVPTTYQDAIHLVRQKFDVGDDGHIVLRTNLLQINGQRKSSVQVDEEATWASIRDRHDLSGLVFYKAPGPERERPFKISNSGTQASTLDHNGNVLKVTHEATPSSQLTGARESAQDVRVDVHSCGPASTVESYRVSGRFPALLTPNSGAHGAIAPVEKVEMQLAPGEVDERSIQIFVKDLTGKTLTFEIKPSETIGRLKSLIQDYNGLPQEQQRLICGGAQLEDGATVSEKIKQGAPVHLLMRLKGGKPVIYLSSPKSITANVRLSLVPQWELSALYPDVPIQCLSPEGKFQQVVQWDVRTCIDGSLVVLPTGLEVAYLFWEAQYVQISSHASAVTVYSSMNFLVVRMPLAPALYL